MKFESGYFVNSKISNYKNYLQRKFNDQSEDLINYFKMKKSDKIMDFGCATGGLIYGFKKLGFKNIKGTDISYWSIKYGKETLELEKELEYYNLNLLTKSKDYLIILDVLEHVPTKEEIEEILRLGKQNLKKNVILRVPVCAEEGEDFFLKVSRNDKTHVQCHCKEWWIKLLEKLGFVLEEELNLNSIYSSTGVLAAVFKTKN